MKRPVLVSPSTARIAATLARSMPGVSVADVIGVALLHECAMLATISAAGLGNRPIHGADVPGLYAQAVNLNAATASRTRIEA